VARALVNGMVSLHHRIALGACALFALAGGCSPGAFDALVGEAQTDGGVRAADAGDAGSDAAPAGGADSGNAGGSAGGGAAGAAGSRPDASAMDASIEADAAGVDANAPPDGGVPPSEAGPEGCPQAGEPASVHVHGEEIGAFTVPNFELPKLGPTARLGDRLLWVVQTSAQSAIWTDPDASPTALPVPAGNLPVMPADSAAPPWYANVGSVVPLNDSRALIYFASFYVFAGGETGLARIGVDAVEAELIHPAGGLFPSLSGMPWIPLFFTGAFLHEESDGESFVYVYACNENPNAPSEQPGGLNGDPCRLARVPVASAEDGSAYRFWGGSDWVSDFASAAIVITRVPTVLSVSYNRYLQKFLAVNSASTGNEIVLRWADRPEGPWHPLDQVETRASLSIGYSTTFGAVEHPALRDPCDRALYVAYIQPIDVAPMPDAGTEVATNFEQRVMRIDLE
jgi:hypothetical protein